MKKALILIAVVSLSCTMEKSNYHSRRYKNPTDYHKSPPKTKGGPNANKFYQ